MNKTKTPFIMIDSTPPLAEAIEVQGGSEEVGFHFLLQVGRSAGAGAPGGRGVASRQVRHGKSLNVNATHMAVRCVETILHASRHVM
jgi:hypothetical protein